MPNIINENGIQIETLSEVVSQLETAYRTIYGTDIVLDQDTPDGQNLNIIAQIKIDMLEFIVSLNSMFDPAQAIGVFLDRIAAFNGVKRASGTPTLMTIAISNENNYALNLDGFETGTPHTITDEEGNNWLLAESQVVPANDSILATYRSELLGKVLAQPDTVTKQVTVITGIEVTNPNIPFYYGVNEESEEEFRRRRDRSTAISSTGYLDGLEAALENISGVTSAVVHENNTSDIDQFGQSPHSIWVIVSGVYDNEEVARVIYVKRGGGEGMNGQKSFFVTRRNGSTYEVKWDDVVNQDVYIFMNLLTINANVKPNIEAIKNQLSSLVNLGVYQSINTNMVSMAVNSIDSNAVVIDSGLSTTPMGTKYSILYPTSKKNKFEIKPENIIITPMILLPANAVVDLEEERQFTVSGGKGPYVFELTQNNSGATITPSGYYTAGNLTGVDIVKVSDSFGNEMSTNVVVG